MSVIDEIKQKIDIVEVVSESFPLQRAGKNFRALCPFHSEKNPSFYVFPERQSWYCFGACQTGGDVFSFVMKKENLPFGEALRLLAHKAGVELTPLREGEKEAYKRLYEANQAATQFYHHILLYSPKAEFARHYLQQRGISLESVLQFQLGYSPEQGVMLKEHLINQGFAESELLGLGLIVERGGGSYDLFRHRLIFPIKDVQGRVVGFGGRALDDSLPKYLNSPGSNIFDKSALLYGLDQAKATIRKQDRVVLVEGYIDVIIAHQYGFNYVVGTMGISLTEKQFVSLKKFTKNIILALDADPAGLQATLRGVEVANKALEHKITPVPDWRGVIRYESALDAEIKVLPLPSAKDPDDIIREKPQTWQGMVEGSMPIMDYLIENLTSQTDLARSREKTNLVRQLKPLFDEIKDPLKWAHYVQKLSRLLKIEEHLLSGALRRPSHRGESQEEIPVPSTSPLEEECLALLLQNPELKGVSSGLLPHYFQESENREIFIAWQGSEDIPSLKEGLEPFLREHLESLIHRSLPPLSPEEKRKVLYHYSNRLKENFLRWRLRAEGEISQGGGLYQLPQGLEEELKETLIHRQNRRG